MLVLAGLAGCGGFSHRQEAVAERDTCEAWTPKCAGAMAGLGHSRKASEIVCFQMCLRHNPGGTEKALKAAGVVPAKIDLTPDSRVY